MALALGGLIPSAGLGGISGFTVLALWTFLGAFVPNRLVYLAKSLADFDSYRIKAVEWEEEILLD